MPIAAAATLTSKAKLIAVRTSVGCLARAAAVMFIVFLVLMLLAPEGLRRTSLRKRGSSPQATPWLDARGDKLLAFLIEFGPRVQDAWVGSYRTTTSRGAAKVGIERQARRSQFLSHPPPRGAAAKRR